MLVSVVNSSLPRNAFYPVMMCQSCYCANDSMHMNQNNLSKPCKPSFMRYFLCSIDSFQELTRRIAIVDIVLAFIIAAAELLFAALPNTYVAIYNVYNMRGEINTSDLPHQSDLFVSLVIITMFLLILEGWLFEVLWKGATEADTKQLNRWLNIRVTFLILNIMLTLYRIYEYQFCFYDLIYIPVTMYRCLEVIVVKGLIIEFKNIEPPTEGSV